MVEASYQAPALVYVWGQMLHNKNKTKFM